MPTQTTRRRRRQVDRRRGQRVPFALNARLTVDQHSYLALVAETHDVAISEALRIVLDDARAGFVGVYSEELP